jgi:hypothetical protein
MNGWRRKRPREHRISIEAARALEAAYQQRSMSELELAALLRGIALGAGIDPARVVNVDTNRRVLIEQGDAD